MRIAAAAAVAVAIVAGAAAQVAAQGDPGKDAGRRTEEIERRREALRERREVLRRQRQDARRGPMASEPFTAVAKIGRQGALSLVNASGTVTVTGSGGDDVRIDAIKRVWDSTDASAKAALPDVAIDVTERQGGVDVRTNIQRRGLLDAAVDFTIAVPAGASVTVRTGSGDVTVSGVRGELRAESVGGGIKATSVGQVRMLRTLSGAISIENADSNDVTVSTLGGSVTINQLKARSADLRTVGGDLVIGDSEAERLIAQSLSGRVEVAARLAKTGRYSLQSQSGDIRLTPLGSQDFEVEAATVSGRVRSDFPITVDDRRDLADPSARAAREARIGRSGRGSGAGGANARILRGVSGGGGPVVTLRSFRGDITIVKR